MNRQPSNHYTWVAHMLLTMVTCLWLYYAHEAHISFSLTVVVASAITLCGGFVTSVRANGLFQRGERAVDAERAVVKERENEFDRLLFSLPALFFVFATLFPDRTQDPKFTMHEFSNWLRWALTNEQVNAIDWMMGRTDRRGRRQMLRGVTGHIEPHERQSYELYLDEQTRCINDEMRMYGTNLRRPVHRRTCRQQEHEDGRRPRRRSDKTQPMARQHVPA